MKVAIISDIHGNLEALNATLKDIKKRNVDKIYCLGDTIAKGFHQKECVELVRENCEIILRGNCDRHFSAKYTKEELSKKTKLDIDRLKWNHSLLTEEQREYMFNLPYCHEFYMSGSLVRIFHATPTADNIPVINEDDIETKYKMFLPSDKTPTQKIADVVLYGHIHHQYMDKMYNKTLINVGSVGNSFDVIRNRKKDSSILETTKCCYLIIEGEYGSKEYTSEISFQFVRVPYNIDKELSTMENNTEKKDYEFELKQGLYRNMEKINKNFERLGIDVEKI